MSDDFETPKDHWSYPLVAMNACGPAREFCASFATAQEAWDACNRVGWMCWLMESTEAWWPEDSRAEFDRKSAFLSAYLKLIKSAMDEERDMSDEEVEEIRSLMARIEKAMAMTDSEAEKLRASVYDRSWKGNVGNYLGALSDLMDMRTLSSFGFSSVAAVARQEDACDVFRTIYPHPPTLTGQE